MSRVPRVLVVLLFLGQSLVVRANMYPNYGAWMEGEITNPYGETSYLGGVGTQTLTGEAFGTGDVQSYVEPTIGKTGLYVASESPAATGTYVWALSRYYDRFTFYPYTILPTRIHLSVGMSFQFLSPSGGVFEGYPKAGQAGFNIILDPDGPTTWEYSVSHTENHTTGGWDTPPGSMGLYGTDFGYWLWRYTGRPEQTFQFGDEVTLVLEYYTWARNGATVNSLYTGDFHFTLPEEVKEAGGGLVVTSTSGFYQTDGLVPTTTTTTPPESVCGDGNGDASVTASDALLALRTAVGSASCNLCVCDTDSSGSVFASDALRILRAAVGQAVTLVCVPC